jgi:hypothetical protein
VEVPDVNATTAKRTIKRRRSRCLTVTQADLERERMTPAEVEAHERERPKTRGDCEHGLRPCPWVGCRHHLFLEVKANGRLQLTFPDLEPDEIPATCSLDIADCGELSRVAIGTVLGMTHQAVELLEQRTLPRLVTLYESKGIR